MTKGSFFIFVRITNEIRNESQEKDLSPAWTERNSRQGKSFGQTPTSARKSYRIKDIKKL